ncbi:hypothetical protein DFJ73DRAFT_820716 [Zopfochytrium polystomum]|nr:hypothetical protein DFJ73DRAFT_820716 [Zopfochytrium polystomum]
MLNHNGGRRHRWRRPAPGAAAPALSRRPLARLVVAFIIASVAVLVGLPALLSPTVGGPLGARAEPSPLFIHRKRKIIVSDKILPSRTHQKNGEVHKRNTDCVVGKVTVTSWLRRYDLCEVDVGIAELCERRDYRGAYDLAWDAHRQAGYDCGRRQKSFKGNEHHTVCPKLVDDRNRYKDMSGMYFSLNCKKKGPSQAAPPNSAVKAVKTNTKKKALPPQTKNGKKDGKKTEKKDEKKATSTTTKGKQLKKGGDDDDDDDDDDDQKRKKRSVQKSVKRSKKSSPTDDDDDDGNSKKQSKSKKSSSSAVKPERKKSSDDDEDDDNEERPKKKKPTAVHHHHHKKKAKKPVDDEDDDF